MRQQQLILQIAAALIFSCAVAQSWAEVVFPYLTNAEAKKSTDKITADLFNAKPVALPSGFVAGEKLSMDGPTPEMKKYSAAQMERLALLERAAILGQPGALLMKCYMGTDASAPQWIVSEGIAWCSIIINDAPGGMAKIREAAQRAMDAFRKNNPSAADAVPDVRMLATLHQRLAQPEKQGPIQSVDPVIVAKQGVPAEKMVGFALFQLGRDFNDYLNGHDLDRAIFYQQFAVAPGAIIKLDEYAKFATAYNFAITLARHPQLGQQEP